MGDEPHLKLMFTKEAAAAIQELEATPSTAAKLKKVRKALGFLSQNPRHPGLNSHKYTSITGASGEDVWESYVENNTPSAWRIFWHWGPDEKAITVVSITPHP